MSKTKTKTQGVERAESFGRFGGLVKRIAVSNICQLLEQVWIGWLEQTD